MNTTLAEAIYLELRDDGLLVGDPAQLSTMLAEEYVFRGGWGDVGDVDMWFHSAVTEEWADGRVAPVTQL